MKKVVPSMKVSKTKVKKKLKIRRPAAGGDTSMGEAGEADAATDKQTVCGVSKSIGKRKHAKAKRSAVRRQHKLKTKGAKRKQNMKGQKRKGV